MDNGIYVALSRQVTLWHEMEVRANNIANVNTAGFNSEHLLFKPYLFKDPSSKAEVAFTQDVASYRNTNPGNMKVTGGQFDVAIAGPGYLVVETPLGERYTRAGNLQVDAGGTLVTADGYPVLDASGQHITFEEQDRDFSIGEAGNITIKSIDKGKVEERGQINIVEFTSPQLMERVGNTLFKTSEPSLPAEKSRLVHGSLEMSNVEPVSELTSIMEISRMAASTAKMIEAMYELERRASNTLAKQA